MNNSIIPQPWAYSTENLANTSELQDSHFEQNESKNHKYFQRKKKWKLNVLNFIQEFQPSFPSWFVFNNGAAINSLD